MAQVLPSAWPARYVGIPFADRGRSCGGCDCWGLLRLVLRLEAGIEVPDLGEAYPGADAADDVAGLVGLHLPDWMPVPPGTERPLDGILLRVAGRPIHVGVVVRRGLMLHVMRGIDACLERYDRPLWRDRVEGIYRWPQPPSEPPAAARAPAPPAPPVTARSIALVDDDAA